MFTVLITVLSFHDVGVHFIIHFRPPLIDLYYTINGVMLRLFYTHHSTVQSPTFLLILVTIVLYGLFSVSVF